MLTLLNGVSSSTVITTVPVTWSEVVYVLLRPLLSLSRRIDIFGDGLTTDFNKPEVLEKEVEYALMFDYRLTGLQYQQANAEQQTKKKKLALSNHKIKIYGAP